MIIIAKSLQHISQNSIGVIALLSDTTPAVSKLFSPYCTQNVLSAVRLRVIFPELCSDPSIYRELEKLSLELSAGIIMR